MAQHNNSKYDRRYMEKLLIKMGFEVNNNTGKGSHVVYAHHAYNDLKIVIPTHSSKTLKENEMSNICGNLVIAMEILGMDTSIFVNKEGIEGKLMKAVKLFKKNSSILFTPIVRNCLGITSDEDIMDYINTTRQKVLSKTNGKGQQ